MFMKFDDRVYDVLKYIAQYVLPGLGTLYFALAQIWGLPYGQEVVGTITAIDTFLGVLLGISAKSYAGDGTLHIDTSNPNKDTYRFEISTPLEDIPGKKTVTFNIDSDQRT